MPPQGFRPQLIRGLKKIFRHYRDLPNNEQEAYLLEIAESFTRAQIDDPRLKRFLQLMKAAEEEGN